MEKKDKNLNVPNLRFPEFSGEWEKYSLNDISTIYGRIGFRGYTVADIVEKGEGAIALSPTNIDSNCLTYEKDNTYISTYKYEESPEIKIFAGDIIFVKTGSTVGKVAFVDNIIDRTTLNPQLVVLKQVKCNPYFLYLLMAAPCFQKHIKRITVGGAVPTLSQNEMGRIGINLPPNAEQDRISALFKLLNYRIETQKKIIEDLKKLKDAIRTKLFTSLESHCNEYDEIRNMLHYEQPSAYLVNSTEYSEDYPTPVLTANKAFILGYTDEEQGVYDKGDCIIFDDFTMDLKYVTFPFKVKSSAIKILTPKQNIDLYFIYEYLLYLGLVSEEHKRHYISEIESMNIIHPQLKEQRQISQALRSLEMQVGNAIALQNLLVKQKQHFLSRMFI